MDLAALADFNAVAQYQGFGPASRALDRPKATLSRHVAELERALGVRLVERGARSLRLTEEGRALHERTRGLLAEIDEAGEAVAARAPVPSGRLRISAPMVFGHVVLSRIAARYALAYPQVELEIVAEDRVADPVQDAFDLVVRINPPPDALLVGRCIATDRRVLVASPGFALPAASHGPDAPDASAAPLALPAVMPGNAPADTRWTIEPTPGGVLAARVIAPQAVLRMSSLLMIEQAVMDGAGVAMLPGLLAERGVRAGALVALGVEAGPAVEIWALYSSRRLLSAKVRAFLDLLQRMGGMRPYGKDAGKGEAEASGMQADGASPA